MAIINPSQLMGLLKMNGPQVLARLMVQNIFPNDPTFENLIQMGIDGDQDGVEKFAQQFFNQQGKDFNSEFKNFISMIKNM